VEIVMGRFYLHLREFSGDLVHDEEGSDLPSLRAARDRAMISLRELVGEAIKHGNDLQIEAVIVADEQGNQVASVPIAVALPKIVVKALQHPMEVVPADRLAEYRRNADGCRARAEAADDPDDKRSWLNLAEAWLQMLPREEQPTASADVRAWPKATDEDSKASH
jgi:hypothetical protein